MKIADRILELRKQKGISQEALADQLGVSRQAVSKWESEQSTPDMDKIILMSEFFEVTTDYLLKGIEPTAEKNQTGIRIGNALSVFAPFMAWTGLVTACVIWCEYQNAFAVMDGFIWMAGSIVVICCAKLNRLIGQKELNRYWIISFPAISFFVLSVFYNLIFSGSIIAPYPLVYGNHYVFFGIWALALLILNAAVETALYNGNR
jgi:transcriptional regulator with XRE-family HTH domain